MRRSVWGISGSHRPGTCGATAPSGAGSKQPGTKRCNARCTATTAACVTSRRYTLDLLAPGRTANGSQAQTSPAS